MRVMILGADGYIGWPLTMRLLSSGHEVCMVDSLDKRRWEERWSAGPVFPLPSFSSRVQTAEDLCRPAVMGFVLNISVDAEPLYELLKMFRPEAIIHLAEQPSAPLSMLNREMSMLTLHNNLDGTMNLIMAVGRAAMEGMPMPHVVKLGTMGEYGTPDGPIHEGYLHCCETSAKARWLMPKQPGSWYHLSKVHDSNALEFACRMWGLRVTDINQGPVWGIETKETPAEHKKLRTSFHADELFGTVINRFCFQAAAGLPLTVYGTGGQTRGYIALEDVMEAISQVLKYPPAEGEFRVINQIAEVWTVLELATLVQRAVKASLPATEIVSVPNPRAEKEAHPYSVEYWALGDMGFRPSKRLQESEIRRIVELLLTDRRNLRRIQSVMKFTPHAVWRKDEEQEFGGSGI